MNLWADYHRQQGENVIVIEDSERKVTHNKRTVGVFMINLLELRLPESIVFMVEVVHLSGAENITDSL
jgi:hypothetical protein